ncbi:MAG: hypothetical protein JWO80_613 [Bryobacterales bacterium]|nr:hypothetical protein [Bryobacterales bacterium]
MKCSEIGKALIEGAVSPGVEEHLRSCARCRELAEALTVPGAEPSEATLSRIERSIIADLRPVRPIAPKSKISAVFAAIFASVVAIGVLRIGAFAFRVMSPFQAAVILTILALSAGLLAYSLVNQMSPGSLHRISPRLLPLSIMLTLAIAIAVVFQFHEERNFWAESWACFRTGTPLAALAAAPIWLVLRLGAILSPATAGAATGLLAGLAGTMALEIHCPNLDASHILVAHLGVAVFGAIAGFLLGAVTRLRA